MAKIIVTMAVFTSFAEITKTLAEWGLKVKEPKDPFQAGIHFVAFCEKPFQHALVVVNGNFDETWELLDLGHDESITGPAIITVAFGQGSIPFLRDGEETNGKIKAHTQHAPVCVCIRVEGEVTEKRHRRPVHEICIKAISGEVVLPGDLSHWAEIYANGAIVPVKDIQKLIDAFKKAAETVEEDLGPVAVPCANIDAAIESLEQQLKEQKELSEK